jgi:hypothetical protein
LEETCPVDMSDLEPCGRPIWDAPAGVDQVRVCLMHSHDRGKDQREFWKEIDAILQSKSRHHRPTDRFDFKKFVFIEARFRNTWFGNSTTFLDATFLGNAYFYEVRFLHEAIFTGAVFSQVAFWETTFGGDAYFINANFAESAEFSYILFLGVADFNGAVFKEPARVVFSHVNEQGDPSGVSRFGLPGPVQRDPPGLRARLVRCQLQGVRFEDVNWNRRNGRLVLEDEMDLGGNSPWSYEAVADAYSRLVSNFQKSRQFSLAEDCFIGEMEMRRRNPKTFLLAGFPRMQSIYEKYRTPRWFGEKLSVTNMYQLLSNYGSSYTRAFIVLCAILLAFGLLFPVLDLRMSAASAVQAACPLSAPGSPQAATISWSCALAHPQRSRQLWGTLKAGLLASAETATFQKTRMIEPATSSCKVAEIAESVIVPGQLALFLLALRRRLRR